MLEGFEKYLGQKRFTNSTIKAHLDNVSYFSAWLEKSGLVEAENVVYNDLLNYVQYEQHRNMDVATINLRLGSISKYFEYLKKENIITRNAARTLRIKGKLQKVMEYPLKYDELEQLYHVYKSLNKEPGKNVEQRVTLTHQRNIVIVGLMIWQGLHTGELDKLETTHINLTDGIIYIPSTSRSNNRELRLHTQQILPLHHYLYGGIREKLGFKGDRLFARRALDIVRYLLEELKGINPQVRNAQHVRASVILHWLKQHNKRQVQYMVGHKHIDSTEKYAVQEMEGLTGQLAKHHPFG